MNPIVVRQAACLISVAVGLACQAPNPAFTPAAGVPGDAASASDDLPGFGGARGTGARDASTDAAIGPGIDVSPPILPRDAIPVTAARDTAAMTPPDLACVDICINASTLRSCSRGDTSCALGCSAVGTAHCQVRAPSGGGVTPADLDAPGTAAVTIATSTTLHSDSGQIDGVRGPGSGAVINGIGFHVVNGVGVFTFASLVIARNVRLLLGGPNAVALVSSSDIAIGGTIDARGTCLGTAAGPGGSAGGAAFMPGGGPGAGVGGKGFHDNASGGAGAGFGSVGGRGGASSSQPSPAGGTTYMLLNLRGGSGGGGGGGPLGGPGGGGGGAIQLVAKGVVNISSGGGINAGGCGGHSAPNDGGSGGGSGGAILIEATTILIAAAGTLAVNGGGGGGSDSSSRGGVDGQLSAAGSAGGSGGAAPGGKGGASLTLTGDPGGDARNGGGGGGGVGRIWLYSATGAATLETGAVLSPRLDDPATSTVQGKLPVR